MIHTILDAIEFVLKDIGAPQSPYWLASQMMETKLWRASERDVRAELEQDIEQWGEKSQFVKCGNGEFGLRSWNAQ